MNCKATLLCHGESPVAANQVRLLRVGDERLSLARKSRLSGCCRLLPIAAFERSTILYRLADPVQPERLFVAIAE